MNEERHEVEIREQARAEFGAGKVIPGSGRRGTPRRMAQMVSVRLDGELVGKLRIVARERDVTLSELLREGAELILEDAYATAQSRPSFTISGAMNAVPDTSTGRVLAAR